MSDFAFSRLPLIVLAGLIATAVPFAAPAQDAGLVFRPAAIDEYFWLPTRGFDGTDDSESRGRWLPPPGGMETSAPWISPTFPGGSPQTRRASYPVEAGSFRIVPTVVFRPSSGARVPGLVSFGLERSAPRDPLRAKAELDWSGRSGGSFELGYVLPERSLSVRGNDRPAEVATMLGGRVPGKALDGSWVERFDPRTTAAVTLSNDRLELDGSEPQNTASRVEVRHRATDSISLLAQMDNSGYSDVGALDMRRAGLSVGTSFDAGPFGAIAVYRTEENSWTAISGRGGRVALRGAHGGWSASVFADVQQQAATIELDIHGLPELPAEMSEVGLVAANPESAMQALRDRPALFAQHGVALGALRIDPLRLQSGIDLQWQDSGSQRTKVGARVTLDDIDAAMGARRAVLGSLYASWRVVGKTDVSASLSNWSIERELYSDGNRSMFRISVRAPL